jgi:hypothetical protein
MIKTMSKMLTLPPSKAITFMDTPEERKALKPIFPVLPDAPIYPHREVMARIIYQADETIRAEYLPGVANYTVWMVRKIPWDRWKQTGEGCWLGATVDAEEAEYIVKLTESQWSEGGQCEVIRGPGVGAKSEIRPMVAEPVVEPMQQVIKEPKNVIDMAKVVTRNAKAKSKSKKIDHSEQLSLFG